jgi:Tfp pilus tip-associated adhesin PilY1
MTRDDADSSDIQSIYAIWDDGSNSRPRRRPTARRLRLVEQTITNVVDNSFDPGAARRIVSRTR